tara:strand:- start:555 stop:1718 length:1164 start_codon:yes stop_codon:yes gene_type:complete
MNIHEHQAKEILKEFGAPVSNGIAVFSIDEIDAKLSKLRSGELVLKAQIHAGGRGKAGGVKLIKNKDNLLLEAKKMMGKTLVTHQTGPEGKEVKRIYIEEASNILKEFYLSCLIDRETSKIAFISSTEGGMDIEKIAKEKPEKIITKKIDYKEEGPSESEINEIISIFNFKDKQQEEARKLIKILYKILIEKDASLIEINPLIINDDEKLICLDAKMNFDDNAMYRRPEILKLRDLNEEENAEIEASKVGLAYIKLNGSIGCMVNGAGLAMATMDIIKLYGQEPANFLDVGGGATKEQVSAAFKLILSDKKVKGILINIFGGIMRCDVLAQGVVEAAKETNIKVPLVVRLAGTNFKKGKEILDKSALKILSASDLNDAAKKIVDAIK